MLAASELQTIRDFLRYAVSSFRAANLVHGHGAATALDEAAFIILESLSLPVDDINPWLDARLTKAECEKLQKLIDARVKTRKPAAYLLKKTYMHGIPFYVDERVIVPRSYIGELLVRGLQDEKGEAIIDTTRVSAVLDLCTGSGCLAILAANLLPDASIDATDLSQDALTVAAINVKNHDLAEHITLHKGDLFAPVAGKAYDLILANPPYVAAAEVKAFPPEYKKEPVIAHLGGDDGLDIVRRILKEAPSHLNDGGVLVCEIGTGREIIEAEFSDLKLFWLDTEESSGEVFLFKK
jgi:ribosomal protein L3 glutamine methyltransferase